MITDWLRSVYLSGVSLIYTINLSNAIRDRDSPNMIKFATLLESCDKEDCRLGLIIGRRADSTRQIEEDIAHYQFILETVRELRDPSKYFPKILERFRDRTLWGDGFSANLISMKVGAI